jgi:hypothetical protein
LAIAFQIAMGATCFECPIILMVNQESPLQKLRLFVVERGSDAPPWRPGEAPHRGPCADSTPTFRIATSIKSPPNRHRHLTTMPRKLPPPKNAEKIWFELLPKPAEGQHGRHIYMFRNTHTNQVLYTLYPMIWQRSLRQLDFIGKHSVPPKIRPDLWTAHCRIGPFPTAEQGLDAIKKLQEFRKLRQLNWQKTNPGWGAKPKKTLIRLLMNQRRTATADLAAVLGIQSRLHERMWGAGAKRRQEQNAFLRKRWAGLRAVAETAEAKMQELEKRMADCRSQLGDQRVSVTPNDKEVARLNTLMTEHRRDMRQLIWTQKIVEEHDAAQEALKAQCEADGAEATAKKNRLLAAGKNDEAAVITIPTIQDSAYVNQVRHSLLPKSLKSLPKPFSIHNIECQWADLFDAEWAGTWPQGVVQNTMPHIANRQKKGFLTEDEYLDIKEKEREAFTNITRDIAENMRRKAAGEPLIGEEPVPSVQPVEVPQQKTGIMKYLPEFKNPFKRSDKNL